MEHLPGVYKAVGFSLSMQGMKRKGTFFSVWAASYGRGSVLPLLEGRIRLSFLSPADLGLDGLIDNLWHL